MTSSYKRLGDYIQLVDERNKDLEVKNLVGLTINKIFIPSVANIIGTDMSNYKIIRKNQFACSTMQVRRDKKMPLALYKNDEPAIISQAYPIFEIIDVKELLPEYLMMWFTRAEFDREACFHAVGGVRGSLEWDDFLDFKLPIPSVEKQQEMVNEYHTIQNRINLNNQLIAKLEETAQAIYKQWFVDFEFPFDFAQGKPSENGKPYKSNGGKMVWCEELEKEIPEGWEYLEIGKIANIKAGGDKPKIFSENKTLENIVPVYSNGVTNKGLYGFTNKSTYTKNSITISARGTIGYSVLRNTDFDAIVRLIVLMPKINYSSIYLWQTISKIEFDNSGSVQNQLTIPQVSVVKIVFPKKTILEDYYKIQKKIYNNIETKEKETQKLEELKELLLGRMVRS